jgi:cobalt-zinc-cadmium efflux system membrane fusion protein
MALWGVSSCSRSQPESAHEEGESRGPQGGRLFKGDGFQLELWIEETGIPPEFRAKLYDGNGEKSAPADGRLTVILERFAGRRDSIGFHVVGDRFQSVRTVKEPHSYNARIALERGGKRHEWTFEQQEGRVELVPAAVASAGIQSGTAGPRLIEVHVETTGEIRLNAERVIQVRPRFPGVVQQLEKRLGDTVRPDELLAVIHSNESLTDYEIRATMSGTVVSREVAVGQTADHETVLYTIADLSTVWADVALYPQIAGQVRRGQRVRIRAAAGDTVQTTGTLSYVGPLLEQDTRVSRGRIVLPNVRGQWQPGLFVTAQIVVDQARVDVAVPEAAIVRTSRGPAVFRAEESTFELQPVAVGRTDGVWTEIVDGLESGARIVVSNAYLLKAELGKSEATHAH